MEVVFRSSYSTSFNRHQSRHSSIFFRSKSKSLTLVFMIVLGRLPSMAIILYKASRRVKCFDLDLPTSSTVATPPATDIAASGRHVQWLFENLRQSRVCNSP